MIEQIDARLLALKEALRRAEDQALAIRGGIAELELLRESLAAAPPAPLGLGEAPKLELAPLDGAFLLRDGA